MQICECCSTFSFLQQVYTLTSVDLQPTIRRCFDQEVNIHVKQHYLKSAINPTKSLADYFTLDERKLGQDIRGSSEYTLRSTAIENNDISEWMARIHISGYSKFARILRGLLLLISPWRGKVYTLLSWKHLVSPPVYTVAYAHSNWNDCSLYFLKKNAFLGQVEKI